MMLTHFGTASLSVEWDKSVVCIGTFDGVHLGHQALLKRAAELARESEIASVAVTFDRHPAATLHPEICPPAISSLEENLDRIAALGVSACVVLTFDKGMAEMSANQFYEEILLKKLKISQAVIGSDFAFGHDRQGTTEWLAERIAVEVIQPVRLDGERVSSREIRMTVTAGEIEKASRLLGRPFQIDAVVVGGQKLGRELGFPTINLDRSIAGVTPADGIYGGDCITSVGVYKAAISIGGRPTFKDQPRTLEAYLIDFPYSNLYGQAVSLRFHRRLREERRFETLEALKTQIAIDVEQVTNMSFKQGI